MDDSFTLYDLKVEVIGSERPMVCSHKEGDYFLVIGENLVFPQTHSFSMYSLAALLPPAAPCPAGTATKSTVPSAPDCFSPETAILLPA